MENFMFKKFSKDNSRNEKDKSFSYKGVGGSPLRKTSILRFNRELTSAKRDTFKKRTELLNHR